MVNLVSVSKYEPIDYVNIFEFLESKLKQNKRPDGRSLLDFRMPNVTIDSLSEHEPSKTNRLLSSLSLTSGNSSLNVRIYAAANYSPQKNIISTNVEFNKLDEDEIGDVNGHNLNYGFYISTIIDNILTALVGNQLEQDIQFDDKIITCYWSLEILISFNCYDGNGLDLSVLGTNIALKNLKLPIVSVNNEGKFVLQKNNNTNCEIKFPPVTFCVTFCKIDKYIILDPTLIEETHGNNFTIILSANDQCKYQILYYTNADLGFSNANLPENQLKIARETVKLLSKL